MTLLFRCSSLGKIMSEAKSIDAHLRTPEVESIIGRTKRSDDEKALIESLKLQSLSEGAKSHIRMLATEAVYSFTLEVDARVLEKGRRVEHEVIALVNRLRGLNLQKNVERRNDDCLSGECDLFDPQSNEGHDAKAAWSAATMPICRADIEAASTFNDYVWQMRGYMRLWNASRWWIQYGLVNTPEDLIGYEDPKLHDVSHIPAHHRLTSYCIERDLAAEALIPIKVAAARRYYAEVIAEFDATHVVGPVPRLISLPAPTAPAAAPTPNPAPASPAHQASPTAASALVADPFSA